MWGCVFVYILLSEQKFAFVFRKVSSLLPHLFAARDALKIHWNFPFLSVSAICEGDFCFAYVSFAEMVSSFCVWLEGESRKGEESISLKSLFFLLLFAILWCFFRFRKYLPPIRLFHLFQLQAISSQIPKPSLVFLSFAQCLFLQCTSFPKIFFLCEVIFLLKEFLHLV